MDHTLHSPTDSSMGRIPSVFLTYDACKEETVHTINAYQGVENIEFLVPYNQARTRVYYEDRLNRDIAFRLIRTAAPIVDTLAALLDESRDQEWIFWATADRYPYTQAGILDLRLIARALLTPPPALDTIQSVRLTDWQELKSEDDSRHTLAGVAMRSCLGARYGQWQHQFVRRHCLERAVRATAPDGGLMDFHKQLGPAFKTDEAGRPGVRYLIPDRPILKFEEPTLNGRHTTNFFMRSLHRGRLLDTERLGHESSSFASPAQGKARNAGWPADQETRVQSLCAPAPATRFQIVSPGGVGSKMICKWLEPDGNVALWTDMHSHRRLPPPRANENQRFIYVFGDPRDAVLSLFNRRIARTQLHGFTPAPGAANRRADNFVQRHGANLQAEASLIDPEWDLEAYLDNGCDLLRLEEHFDFWFYGDQPYPVSFVRYEHLAHAWRALADELGLQRTAPDIKPRGSNWRALPVPVRDKLDALYGPFAARLSGLPALSIRGEDRSWNMPAELEAQLNSPETPSQQIHAASDRPDRATFCPGN